jgi:RHH-type proline utilization regulon transcriptional repressor/proline dehydrogenase/delta 1-pyrroline-5-carboxylate dehydrogenase
MADRFIVGEDVDAAAPELRRLWKHGVGHTVDLLGEATVTEAEAEAYFRRCRDALDALVRHSATWPEHRTEQESDRHGPIPRANLSIKVSALTPHARPEAPRRGVDSARRRLRELLAHARDLGAHLHIDMESLDLRETVTELALETLSESEYRSGPSAGIVVQAYLRDSEAELGRLLEWAEATPRERPLTVRLVKGAYWDQEVVEAKEAGWEVPVFEGRAACDRSFERLSRALIGRADLVRPAIASHNLRSVAHAIAAAEAAEAEDVLELQVLRGLGDDLQTALAREGLRVRTYCPVGDLIAGMAYLVRRLLENSSNDSFLRIRASAEDPAELLAAP